VRLGNIGNGDDTTLSQMICDRAGMLPDCATDIAVEMEPIDTVTFDGLDDPIQCVDREQNLTPAVTFNPGAGGQAQELMLIRVCVAADPFLRLTGFVNSMPINADGDYVLVSRSIFVNEPSS
jgi:hypothetical protein